MNILDKTSDNSISKYIKPPRENTLFYRASVFYIFCLYVMPQYFGIPNPIFDLTIVRIAIVILLFFIAFSYTRLKEFFSCITQDKMSLVLLPYIVVLLYTMVLRADLNALLNPFIELLEMYLLIYVIKDCVGTERIIKMILGFIYFLIVLGFVEMVIQRSPFSYLETIKGTYTGQVVRNGNYRIMSSTIHSIGYGLLLVSAMPFAGLDVEKGTYDLFRRPFLLLCIIINIFATGSRSSLGIMFAELVLMYFLSDREFYRKNALIIVTSIVAFTVITIGLQGTSIGKYIMLQLTSLIDTFFGTNLAVKYGAEMELEQSASYRKLLKRVFKISWLNPILGIGRKRMLKTEIDGLVIESVDNFYIAEYVRYAYPGMISYIAFLAYVGLRMLKDVIKTRSATIRMLFIGTVCFCLHLYIADSLQTLKYLYVLYAIYICCEKKEYIPEEPGRYFRRRFSKRESKYVRK